MEFKGTKGEWKVAKSDGIKVEKGYKSKYVVKTDKLIVCDFIISKGYSRQAKHDAKLIAAAPELLEACQNIDKIYTDIERMVDGEVLDMLNKVREVINKALK